MSLLLFLGICYLPYTPYFITASVMAFTFSGLASSGMSIGLGCNVLVRLDV